MDNIIKNKIVRKLENIRLKRISPVRRETSCSDNAKTRKGERKAIELARYW